MSHKRSFGYMSNDELYIKRAYDNYRLDALNKGMWTPIKDYGLDGLDESLFVLSNSLWFGMRDKRKDYFADQIRAVDKEITQRPGAAASDEYQRLLSVELNPATFNMLRENRMKMRLERIMQMHDQGEELFPSEYSRNIKRALSEKVDSGLSLFGNVGETIRRNKVLIGGIALLALLPYEIPHWISSKKYYDAVAQDYVLSHEVGKNALALKRDIPKDLGFAVLNLTHTPEVTISIGEDSEITIPEKPSMPGLARDNIWNMGKTLNNNISDPITLAYKTVSSEDKKKILEHGKKANDLFESAYQSLAFATDNSTSYPVQEGEIILGNNSVQKAVDIMESYMPSEIVSEENNSHRSLTAWKWLTYISAGLGSMFSVAGAKSIRRRKLYGRYY